jgi:methyl-accepting chemotaxis protein
MKGVDGQHRQIVRKTVEVTGSIEASSQQIERIICVKIAFPTALLALNGAIEVACAGDAGRGIALWPPE